MQNQQGEKDFELQLFSHAMDILVNASRLQFNPFVKDFFVSSVGVPGYGNIGTYDRLAGALNFNGFRTKTGKYIRGNYLKLIKSNLQKKYGKEEIEDLVYWKYVSTNYYH
jgi:hypothetical protein